MAFEIFLKIDGIKGESTDPRHRDEIEVTSFSWGTVQQGATSTGSGGGAGKVSFQDLHILMPVSQASPQLFLACAQGRHVKTAVLTCRRSGGRNQLDFLTLTLTDVTVTSYQTNGQSEGGALMDAVSFAYDQIAVDYRPQKADGSLEESAMSGWNLKTVEPLD